MDIDASGNTNWLYDYAFGISAAGGDFPANASGGFIWLPRTFKGSSDMSMELEYSVENSATLEDHPPKRLKFESCASVSRACREKLRRDRLNERFLELSSILEPGGLPKTDKAALLRDAVRMVTQLRSEAQMLKETNKELLVKIKELKAEKNELRNEKNMLKADKEKLEQQVKELNAKPSVLLHPCAASRGQPGNHKLIPFIGYPGIAMWQFMPPRAIDTSKDHLLRPPVA